MSSLTCADRCAEFCKSSAKTKALFSLSDLYPGLTSAEKALVSQSPQKMLTAYKLSWTAEGICQQVYPSSETNDESDACRHFVWAALMTSEFNAEYTQQILDAHEQEPSQPTEEKAMDLANNQRGVSFAAKAKLSSGNKEKILIDEFKKLLRDGKLVVLRSRFPKEPGHP